MLVVTCWEHRSGSVKCRCGCAYVLLPMNAPKVFLSHASEDKDRFVLRFARRLRERGVDVWLDKWEIQPGDSLVRKIFDEGLHGAAAVIIVVSSNSANKPWVREEIDASFVRRVTEQTRLIPVVIDECVVPAPLRHLLWVRITDLHAYDRELETVVNTLLGRTEKPPLGSQPKFRAHAIPVPGLDAVDSVVLLLTYDAIIQSNSPIVDYEYLRSAAEKLDVSGDAVTESLQILANRALIEATGTLGRRVAIVKPTRRGFETYLAAKRDDYLALVRAVAAQIVNNGETEVSRIAERLNEPFRIVEHVVDTFSTRGWLTLGRSMSHSTVISTSPELKRFLRG